MESIKDTTKEIKRSKSQNDAMHKYFEMVAHELRNQGQTMQDVIQKISMVEITPTTNSIKEIVWKPVQEVVLGKTSTTQLTTKEINQVYEVVSMFLAKEFKVDIPFPSQELTTNYLQSYDNLPNR